MMPFALYKEWSVLEVHARLDREWVLLETHSGEAMVSAPPFEASPIDLAPLWS